jgi:Sigma-70, region 4
MRELQQSLANVPEHQREALLLIFAYGYTYEEAAAMCRCPAGTIKSGANRARLRLSSRLVVRVRDRFANGADQGFAQERFVQEGGATELHRLFPHVWRVQRGDKDDWDVSVLGYQTAAGFDAGHPAQADVENGAGDAVQAALQQALPGVIDVRGETVSLDKPFQSAPYGRLIVDNRHLFFIAAIHESSLY